eukprot:Polyplicarium_translucidae@DN3200_c0_g1_i4.p1
MQQLLAKRLRHSVRRKVRRLLLLGSVRQAALHAFPDVCKDSDRVLHQLLCPLMHECNSAPTAFHAVADTVPISANVLHLMVAASASEHLEISREKDLTTLRARSDFERPSLRDESIGRRDRTLELGASVQGTSADFQGEITNADEFDEEWSRVNIAALRLLVALAVPDPGRARGGKKGAGEKRRAFFRALRRFAAVDCSEASEKWVAMSQRIRCNAFGIPAVYPVVGGELDYRVVGFGIFPYLSAFNSSCSPNVQFSFEQLVTGGVSGGTSRGPVLRVRSLRPIDAGDEILTCYVDPMLPRGDRRDALLNSHTFHCRCNRCATPLAESRSDKYLQGWACGQCANGVLVPSVEDTTQFICDSCPCRVPEAVVKNRESVCASETGITAAAFERYVKGEDGGLLAHRHSLHAMRLRVSRAPAVDAATAAADLEATFDTHAAMLGECAAESALAGFRWATALEGASGPPAGKARAWSVCGSSAAAAFGADHVLSAFARERERFLTRV